MYKGQPYNCLYAICTKVLKRAKTGALFISLTHKRFICHCSMLIELSFVSINPLLCVNVCCSFKPGLLKSARHFKARGILFGICNAGGVVSVFDLVILFGGLILGWQGMFCLRIDIMMWFDIIISWGYCW